MKKYIYEVCISVLALIAVFFAILDISKGLNNWQTIVDTIILIIFVFDYFIRLILSKEKKKFIKENILDLIAIIPFNSAFRIFRVAKLTKIARLSKIFKFTKLFKVFVYLLRLLKKARKFFNTNGFKYMVFVTIFFIFMGGLLIHYAEGMSFQDGLWWAFVTATTVGYGDISPDTVMGRGIATILMIVGIGLIGSLTSTITSYFFNNEKDSSFKDEVLENIKSKIDKIDTLSDEEIDDIYKVLKSLNK